MIKITRRLFIRMASFLIALLAFPSIFIQKINAGIHKEAGPSEISFKRNEVPLGVDSDGLSRIYLARNGTPEENMSKVIEMMGGIESIANKNDIIVLKPNAMWNNFRITNTNAMKAFIEMVLRIPDFKGEIIIAENHHFSIDNSRGWTTTERNGGYNLNELIDYFHEKGHKNVTKYHWHDAGPNPWPRDGSAGNGKRVNNPKDGDGYVWRQDIVYTSPKNRKCMMTYPIFTSTYSRITIDLKNGAWKNGKYIDRPIKFINFSGINHHTSYGGVTASIKNLMGVTDMTCGYQGIEPEGFYNMHWIGEESFIHLLTCRIRDLFNDVGLKQIGKFINRTFVPFGYFNFYRAGGALGYWMRTIRFPDLNIITAEWIGYGGPYATQKSGFPRTILASRDPVSLDFYAAKNILLTLTREAVDGQSYVDLHNPDNTTGPFRKFLEACQEQGIGNLDEGKTKIYSYEFGTA